MSALIHTRQKTGGIRREHYKAGINKHWNMETIVINNYDEYSFIFKGYLILISFLFLLVVILGNKFLRSTSISLKKKFITIGIIVLAFLIISGFLFLEKIPFLVDGDASRIALESLVIWKNKGSIFTTGWGSYQGMIFFLQGSFLKIFNQKILGLRSFSVIGGIVTVLSTYLLGSEILGIEVGFFASLCLSVMPIFWFFFRTGTDFILVPSFLPLILYLIFLSLRKNVFFLILAGIILGFSQYFYHPVRLVPLVVLPSFIYLARRNWPFKKILIGVFFLIIFSFITYLPMLKYFSKKPKTLSARFDEVSIFKPGWLENEIKNTSIRKVVKRQVLNPFLVFLKETDATKMHYYFGHYLPFVGSCLLVVGIFKLIKEKRPELLVLLFWLIGGIILGGVLVIDSPQDSRYLILLPVVSIFIGEGVNFVLSLFKKKNKSLVIKLIFFLYGANCFWEIYNLELVQTPKYGGNTLIATYAGRYLHKNLYNRSVYFLGNDYLYYNAVPTLPFLAGVPGEDVDQPLIESIKELPQRQALFIILPSRYNDLETLKQLYPNGITKQFQNFYGKTLFWIYEL